MARNRHCERSEANSSHCEESSLRAQRSNLPPWRAKRSKLTMLSFLCPSALVRRSPQRSCDVRYAPEANVSDQ